MSLISTCVSRIKFEIPPEILQEAFQPRRYNPARREKDRLNTLPGSTDAAIQELVIQGRVSIDVNLCSGIETTIALHKLTQERVDPWNIIYRIPKTLTGGRSITAVYSISFSEGNMYSLSRSLPNDSSPMGEAAAGVFQAAAPIPSISSGEVHLIGENVVLITDSQALPGRIFLRCLLTHEPNFANVKPAYYDVFTELAVLAAKAHVYNTMIIRLDEGQIRSGASLGKFREIVEGYADANQLYKEHLRDKWRPAALMNDVVKYRRVLNMVVGGRH